MTLPALPTGPAATLPVGSSHADPCVRLAIFGRVPFFFYVLHLYVIHLLAILLELIVTGSSKLVGFDLWVVYAVWLVVVAALYPVCRWFAGVKARRSDAWLGYL